MDRNFIIKTIEENWEIKESDQFNSKDENLVAAVAKAIGMLDRGEERVAYPDPHEDGWTVATWLKKAVLLSFAINGNELIPGSNGNYFAKTSLKKRRKRA